MINLIKPALAGLLFASAFSSSAVCPWTDAAYRKANYPSDRYYVSYYALLDENNDMNGCISKAVNAVQSQLAGEIYSEVSSVSVSRIEMVSRDDSYSETESFFNEFTSAASARLVNVHIDQDYDCQTSTAHAIAYVSKDDLAEFCEAKVTSGISSVSSKIDNINRLIDEGYKSQAKEVLAEAMPALQSAAVFLAQLTAVRPDKTRQAGLFQEIETLSGKCRALESDLEQAISVYIDANVASQLVRNHPLSGKCKGILAKNGCHPVESREIADYIVKITCDTRTSSNKDDLWFAFADVSLTVVRNRDNKVVCDDALSVKGGGGSEERAHRKALDSSSDKICELIINSLH